MSDLRKIVHMAMVLILLASQVNASEIPNIRADEALLKLKSGNSRFSHHHLKHPDQSVKKMHELEHAQHPFVVVLTCSDSRVPPEIIFDQGLGDIFEIRNAGNVLDEHVLGSIEYAVLHLGVKLVIVMGHQDCGAVKATISDTHETPCITSLKKSIMPAVIEAKKHGGCLLDEAVKVNALLSAKNILEQDSSLSKYVKENGLVILPAYYHLDSGVVEFLK